MEVALRAYRAAAPTIEKCLGIAISMATAILINGLIKSYLPKLEEIAAQVKEDADFSDSISRNFISYNALRGGSKYCRGEAEPMKDPLCIQLFFSMKKHILETAELKAIDQNFQALNEDLKKLIAHLEKNPVQQIIPVIRPENTTYRTIS